LAGLIVTSFRPFGKTMDNCQYEKVIENIQCQLNEIRVDTKELLKFKWQVMAIVSVVSTAISFAVTFIFKK